MAAFDSRKHLKAIPRRGDRQEKLRRAEPEDAVQAKEIQSWLGGRAQHVPIDALRGPRQRDLGLNDPEKIFHRFAPPRARGGETVETKQEWCQPSSRSKMSGIFPVAPPEPPPPP